MIRETRENKNFKIYESMKLIDDSYYGHFNKIEASGESHLNYTEENSLESNNSIDSPVEAKPVAFKVKDEYICVEEDETELTQEQINYFHRFKITNSFIKHRDEDDDEDKFLILNFLIQRNSDNENEEI